MVPFPRSTRKFLEINIEIQGYVEAELLYIDLCESACVDVGVSNCWLLEFWKLRHKSRLVNWCPLMMFLMSWVYAVSWLKTWNDGTMTMDFRLFFLLIVCSILVSLEVNSWFGGRWARKTRIPLVESNPTGFPVRWHMKKCLDSEGRMESDFLVIMTAYLYHSM